MKKIIILLLTLLVACTPPAQEHEEHKTTYNIMKVHSGTNYTTKVHDLTIKFEPEALKIGEEAHLSFTLENEQGQVQLTEHHGAPMHIIAVSKDLEKFHHLHPEFEGPSKLDSHHTFEAKGEYRVWIDFIYRDMNHIIDYDITVTE